MLQPIRYLLRRRKVLAVSSFPVSLRGEASPTIISVSAEERRERCALLFPQVCHYGILHGKSSRQDNSQLLSRKLCGAADGILDGADSTQVNGPTEVVKADQAPRKDETSISDGRRTIQMVDRHEHAYDVSNDLLSVTGTTFDPTASNHYKIMEVCEILQSKPWGTQTQELLEKLYAPFNAHIVTKVIAATTSDAALKFFNWLPCKGFEHNTETYRAMINSLGAAGRLDSMKGFVEEIFGAGKALDSASYGRLIHWCVRNGDTAGAIGFFDKMNREGLQLDVSPYTDMFDLRAREGLYEMAVALYLQMVEEGICPSSRTCAVLTRHLLKVGKLESAHSIVTMLSDLKVKPSMWTYAYLMAAYAKVGYTLTLRKLGREMRDSYSRPGKMFCSAVLSLQREGKGKEADALAEEVWPELSVNERRLKIQESGNVAQAKETEDDDQSEDLGQLTSSSFRELVNYGTEQNFPAQRIHLSLADFAGLLKTEGVSVLEKVKVDWTDDAVHRMLRQLSSSDAAWEFFLWLKACPGFRHDIYNQIYMLRMLARDRKVSALKELLIDMQGSSIGLPLNTFNNLIKDFGFAKNAKAALWTFNQIKESNLQANEETFRLLVHALARDKNPEKALELSALMETLGIRLDTETYTAVIHSLGLAGKSDQAWSVYQNMLTIGLRPDAYTYTVLLNIMNSVGDTEYAIKLYKEMVDGGIAPTAVTQGIMAKVWRKSGNVVESQKLEMQKKFLVSKKREGSLQNIYEILQENLVEQEQSSSLLF